MILFSFFLVFSVINYLHGTSLFGQPLQIIMSRHTQVQMPKEGLEMAKLTQVCTNLQS